jgi:large subunit ribosomal protein L15
VKLHHLRPAPGARTDRVRKGRGDASGKGKSAGRGTKGSKARQTMRIGFEGGQMPLQRRLPKLRGFNRPNKVHWSVVNLDRLGAAFPKGGSVDPDALVQAGLARKNTPVKILGDGELSAPLQIRAHAFSSTAAEKIAAAGGTVEVV